MKISSIIIVASCFFITCIVHSQTIQTQKMAEKENYPKALVDYTDFKNLVTELEEKRQERLISLDVFLKMAKEEDVVILDSRSDFRFYRKHLKGAIHLDFTDFTQDNLNKLIPSRKTKILIYCNNNFKGDSIDFPTKMYDPNRIFESQILSNRKPIMLALNIPTHINLYGYGYKNIYELDELVDVVKDPRITFEGTEVK